MTDDRAGRRVAHTIATGPEDDAAYRALYDLAGMIAIDPDARIIGGHMVGMIAAAFPSPGFIDCRTGDADAGISLTLAAGGAMHKALEAAGYSAESGTATCWVTLLSKRSTCPTSCTSLRLMALRWSVAGGSMSRASRGRAAMPW